MEKVLSCLIPSLVKKGIFGDVEFLDLKSTDNKGIAAQFASTLAFVNLIVKNSSGKEVILPLMIKTILKERAADCQTQFMMEDMMYKEVLPTLGFKKECYPKIYYSSVSLENPEDNVMIFENVKYKHYRNSEIRTFLDFDHISLALKTIARFHSLSFILKHENMEKFLKLTENMKKYYFGPEGYLVYDVPIYEGTKRGIKGFEKQNGPDEVLQDLSRALKSHALVRSQLSAPEEPFDVICHGDFCNNNVMYKYDDKGSPTECILYDFQLSTYGNIAAELAFFLYMHTNSDSREKYWDNFLNIYWETLRAYVPGYIELPTYDDFQEYFGTKAVLGYSICSFYLPMMMDPDVSFWGNLPIEEQIALLKTIAGEEGEKALVDIVSHMLKKKYIYKFLNYVKTKYI